MSKLFGPYSVTTSAVSWRDWAWAADRIAGAAGSEAPAASALTDLRKSRRFIAASAGTKPRSFPQRSCQNRRVRGWSAKPLQQQGIRHDGGAHHALLGFGLTQRHA